MKTDHEVLINCKAKLATAANSDCDCDCDCNYSSSAAAAHNLDDVYCTLALQPAAETAATAVAAAAAPAETQNRTTVKANEQTKMNERCEQRQSDERSCRPLSAPSTVVLPRSNADRVRGIRLLTCSDVATRRCY